MIIGQIRCLTAFKTTIPWTTVRCAAAREIVIARTAVMSKRGWRLKPTEICRVVGTRLWTRLICGYSNTPVRGMSIFTRDPLPWNLTRLPWIKSRVLWVGEILRWGRQGWIINIRQRTLVLKMLLLRLVVLTSTFLLLSAPTVVLSRSHRCARDSMAWLITFTRLVPPSGRPCWLRWTLIVIEVGWSKLRISLIVRIVSGRPGFVLLYCNVRNKNFKNWTCVISAHTLTIESSVKQAPWDNKQRISGVN